MSAASAPLRIRAIGISAKKAETSTPNVFRNLSRLTDAHATVPAKDISGIMKQKPAKIRATTIYAELPNILSAHRLLRQPSHAPATLTDSSGMNHSQPAKIHATRIRATVLLMLQKFAQ